MFGNGKFAKVWKIYPKDKADQKFTEVQLSTSKKTKDGYQTDFADNARLIGEAERKAAELEANDRIKILDCGVTNFYSKEKGRKFTTFCIFDFEFDSKKKQAQSNGEEWIDTSTMSDNELPFAD